MTTMIYPTALSLPKRLALAKLNADTSRERKDSASATWWEREHERLADQAARTHTASERVASASTKQHDRLDEADRAKLFDAAVRARKFAPTGPHAGPEAARALRSELDRYVAAGHFDVAVQRARDALAARDDSVRTERLIRERQERDDAGPVLRTDTAATAHTYVTAPDGSTVAVPWPAGFDEQSARARLRSGGAPVDQMDTMAVRAALLKLLRAGGFQVDDDAVPRQYVGFAVDGDPFAK